uniref:Uncharacterized protein n=1 Tax=Anguilla anguilla TaxID=7936 RepID=A0A0E9VGT0_ANGAN
MEHELYPEETKHYEGNTFTSILYKRVNNIKCDLVSQPLCCIKTAVGMPVLEVFICMA